MKKKLLMFSSLIMAATLIVSGCGDGEEETKKEVAVNTEHKKMKDKEEPKKATDSNDFTSLISSMEKETQGKTKILYENNEPQVHDMEDVSISLDAYTVVELNDFHTYFKIPFGDQTDGGIILAKYTVKNDQDKDVYYMPSLYMTFTSAVKVYGNNRDLLPKEEQLITKLSPQNRLFTKSW